MPAISLVNNAGIQHVAPVQDFPDRAKWDAIIAINLSLGLPHHRRRASQAMRERWLGPGRSTSPRRTA